MIWLIVAVVAVVVVLWMNEKSKIEERQKIYEQRQHEEAARQRASREIQIPTSLSECYSNFAQMVRAIRTTKDAQKYPASFQRAWIQVFYQKSTGLFDVTCGYDACTNVSVRQAFETGRILQQPGLNRVDEGIAYNLTNLKGIKEEFSNNVIIMLFHSVNQDSHFAAEFVNGLPDMNDERPNVFVRFDFD